MSIPKTVIDHLTSLRVFMRGQFRDEESSLPSFFKNWPHGFHVNSNLIYDFQNNDRKHYLSEWKRIKYASRINGRRDVLVDDKFVFHKMNEDNTAVVPIQFIIFSKQLFQYSRSALIPVSLAEFYRTLRSFPAGLIIKPFADGGGARISKVVLNNGEVQFTGHCADAGDFISLIKNGGSYLLTEVIVQTGFSHTVFPKSLNTIRVLTMVDPVTNVPFIASAVHRFGTERSGIIDNWTAGGLCFAIDSETGRLGKGASHPYKGEMKWYSHHPETGVEIENQYIPNWQKLNTSVLKMASRYFYLPYVGWDIVPMEDGLYFLEGNFNSGVNILQIHGGLLKNQAVKNFYQHYKVL